MTRKFKSGWPFLAAGLAACVLAQPTCAAPVSESEFTGAMVQMERNRAENGERVQSLINCLKRWHADERKIENEVSIKRTGASTFTLAAMLRSPAVFHFEVVTEQGDKIAVLLRVEYQLQNRSYSEITDTEGKRVAVNAVCS